MVAVRSSILSVLPWNCWLQIWTVNKLTRILGIEGMSLFCRTSRNNPHRYRSHTLLLKPDSLNLHWGYKLESVTHRERVHRPRAPQGRAGIKYVADRSDPNQSPLVVTGIKPLKAADFYFGPLPLRAPGPDRSSHTRGALTVVLHDFDLSFSL